MPVCPDRELVRSIVTVLGGEWTGSGYEASYDAALDEHRRLHGRLGASADRQEVSGLVGAEPLTQRTLLQQVRADYELLPPVVRGRDELIERLVGLLDSRERQPQVLVGAGGSGKATVALAVAAAARDRGFRVWWVSAADPNRLTRGMLAVATQLGAPVAELNAIQGDPEAGAAQLWRRMDASAGRWLLVFVGADNPEVFAIPGDGPKRRSWLRGSAAGMVLATSRMDDAARWGEQAVLHELGDLPAGGRGAGAAGPDPAGRRDGASGSAGPGPADLGAARWGRAGAAAPWAATTGRRSPTTTWASWPTRWTRTGRLPGTPRTGWPRSGGWR